MKIIITGGAGFVGSHLSDKLLDDGHQIECIDNFYNSKYTNIHNALQYKNYKFINSDVNGDIEKLIDFSSCYAIIHLAAQIHVDKSVLDPIETYKTNLDSTLKLLEITRKYDIQKFIYASTSEVYGSARYKPIDENHPLASPHPYGASKIAADRACNAYRETYGLDISIARCFNIFGPRQKSGVLGSFIPMTINKVLNDRCPTIYGDGKQTRDYVYIDDVINAYSLLLNKYSPGGIYNFGTGIEISILDICNKIIEYCDKDLKPLHIKKRTSEVLSLIADYSKAKNELGWKPTIGFDRGLKTTVDWYKERL